MTVKEISEVADVSISTVSRKGRELYPERFKKGSTTTFTQPQAIQIMGKLRKTGFVQPIQNDELPIQNDELPIKYLQSLNSLVENLVPKIIGSTMKVLIDQYSLTPKNLKALPEVVDSLKIRIRNPLKTKLNDLVNTMTKIHNLRHNMIWSKLYNQLRDETGIDINQILYVSLKTTSNVKAIDIIEKQNLLDKSIIILHEWEKPITNFEIDVEKLI